MKLNWNFLRGEEVQNKNTFHGGVWIFSGTTHSRQKQKIIRLSILSDLLNSSVINY